MGGDVGRTVLAVSTGGLSEVARSDTFKGVTGIGTTKAEKSAKEAQAKQAASLMNIQKEEESKLQERKLRMTARQRGRASLLSGTELGVLSAEDLKKTLG